MKIVANNFLILNFEFLIDPEGSSVFRLVIVEARKPSKIESDYENSIRRTICREAAHKPLPEAGVWGWVGNANAAAGCEQRRPGADNGKNHAITKINLIHIYD